MPFVSGVPVLVRQLDARRWTLAEAVVYRGRTDEITVPAGARTDFASVPRPFVWLVPPYGLWTPAAVLHDHLWDGAPGISPVDVDGLFRRAMRELGVPFLIRWFMWGAVRWAALGRAHRRAGWWRTFPALVAVTLAALPVVAVPAVAVLVGFAVFELLELLAYAVLRLVGQHPDPPRPRLRT